MENKEYKEALAEAANMAKDNAKREALAEMIVEWVQPGHIIPDLVSLFLNTRSLNPGDQLVKRTRKGIKVSTLVPGSIPLKHEITISDRMNYVLDYADVAVHASEWELARGDIGTVEEIRASMMAYLRDYFQAKVISALTSIWTATNTANNYATVATTLTDTVLKAGMDYINQTTSGVRAIVGTREALNPITTFGAFWKTSDASPVSWPVNSNIDEIMRTGWLGYYYGAPIIALQQSWDYPDTWNKMINKSEVLIIGNEVGEFITYGDAQTKQYTDMKPTPPDWNLEIYQGFGMIIDNAMGLYRIHIS